MRNGKKQQTAYGRIDILVKNDDDEPLVVVEVKRPDIDILTGKDQAISYARLLLAPLVVITNGENTRLFDPFTRNGDEITDASESVYGIIGKVKIDDDLRYEAFTNFIGYSLDNLLDFCESQRNSRMEYLKGSRNETGKKYIPELFISPEGLDEKFADFIAGEEKVFLLHGESGIGKTNAVCYLCETFGKEYPALFYAATFLGKSIQEEIEVDFNHHFSQEKSFVALIKRLENIIDRQKTKLIIFIDAVDEYYKNGILITDLFSEIKDIDNIKLCISSKSVRKNDFLFVNGSPTLATSYVEYECQKLDDIQLNSLLRRYGEFFGTTGELQGEIKEHCRSPLFARILHEVYARNSIPQDVTPLKLIERYIENKKSKIDSSQHITSDILLTTITNLMFEKNATSISSADIYKTMSNVEQALKALLDHYILVAQESNVSFYFDRVRDYFLAFKVKKWNEMDVSELEQDIKNLSSNVVAQSALIWYFDVASDVHRKVMEKRVEIRALKYAEVYDKYLDSYFKVLKNRIAPYTAGKIGLLIFKNTENERLGGYTFISVQDDAPRLKVVPVTNATRFEDRMKIVSENGAKVIYGGVIDFVAYKDLANKAKEHLYDEVKNMLEARSLVEGEKLQTERLLRVALNYALELGYVNPAFNYGHHTADSWSRMFPLDLHTFSTYNISHLFLWAKHACRIFDAKHRDRYPGTVGFGRIEPYDLRLMKGLMSSDYQTIKNEVIEELHSPRWEGEAWLRDIQIDKLRDLAESLLKKNRMIDGPILPLGDLERKSPRPGAWSINEYSPSRMKEYIQQFFKIFLVEYRFMVENNFPSLKNHFRLFNQSPSLVVAEFDLEQHPVSRGSLDYAILKNENGEDDEVEIYEKGEKKIFDMDNYTCMTKFGVRELTSWHGMMLDGIFGESVLQEWCYKTIKDELKDVFSRVK